MLKTLKIEAWKLSHWFSHGFRVTKQRKQRERERERLVPENRERSFGDAWWFRRQCFRWERERQRETSSSHREKLLLLGQGCLWENNLSWGYFGKTKWLDQGPKKNWTILCIVSVLSDVSEGRLSRCIFFVYKCFMITVSLRCGTRARFPCTVRCFVGLWAFFGDTNQTQIQIDRKSVV